MKKTESIKARKLRLSRAGKASAAKRNKEYYVLFSKLGHAAQGLGKGSRPRK